VFPFGESRLEVNPPFLPLKGASSWVAMGETHGRGMPLGGSLLLSRPFLKYGDVFDSAAVGFSVGPASLPAHRMTGTEAGPTNNAGRTTWLG